MIENNDKRENCAENAPAEQQEQPAWSESEYSYSAEGQNNGTQFEQLQEEPKEAGGAVPTEQNPVYHQGRYSQNGVNNYTYSNNKWNFNNYDSFEGGEKPSEPQNMGESPYGMGGGAPSPKKPRKSSAVTVFAIILCVVVVLALTGFAGYGFWAIVNRDLISAPTDEQSSDGNFELPPVDGEDGEDSEDEDMSSAADVGIDIDRNHSGITIEDRPGGDNGEVDLPWTVEVAERVSPSVVGIEIYSNDYRTAETPVPLGSGTGIIMSSDGYIVTNAHVVAGAYSIKVTLSDGSEYPAALVGSDTITDLAVVRIDKKGLPAAEFGNSEQMRVGEFVIAIGNPGGLELQGSVTYGMVSAVNREIRTSNSTLVCIQTDTAINPGNSGGALVNRYGQVIGINSAKIALEEYEGIGFAIASNHAQPIIDELIKYGRVTGRIQLGITAQLITKSNAAYNGVKPGLYIVEITNQDMKDNGVKEGDIITHINGEEVTAFNIVSEQLAEYSAGDTVTITVYRPATKNTPSSTFDVEIKLVQDTVD
ncbi:MAG: trypsin-like peptidase domain-containing protein [Oscillospiraceae bacterium]|nr:trypsin-like peptidase domain-containing protein [Oscillospiraceae bacterium]